MFLAGPVVKASLAMVEGQPGLYSQKQMNQL